MASNYVSITGAGAPNYQPSVSSQAALPATNNANGDLRVTLDTGAVYEWSGSAWRLVASPAAAATYMLKASNLSDVSSVPTSRVNLNIDRVKVVTSSSEQLLSTDKTILYTGSIGSLPEIFLPAANEVSAGYSITIVDKLGQCNPETSDYIQVSPKPASGDTVNTQAFNAYNPYVAYSELTYTSDGISNWSVDGTQLYDSNNYIVYSINGTRNQIDKGTVALTDAPNITTPVVFGNVFTVTLGGNRTLDNPSPAVAGAHYQWIIKQDGTGGRTLAFGSAFKFTGGVAPILTPTAGVASIINAISDGTNLYCTYILDVR